MPTRQGRRTCRGWHSLGRRVPRDVGERLPPPKRGDSRRRALSSTQLAPPHNRTGDRECSADAYAGRVLRHESTRRRERGRAIGFASLRARRRMSTPLPVCAKRKSRATSAGSSRARSSFTPLELSLPARALGRLAQSEAESSEIGANPARIGVILGTLVPKMEAIGGDGSISHLRLQKRRNPALERDLVRSG